MAVGRLYAGIVQVGAREVGDIALPRDAERAVARTSDG
jgi:hypothetical protein